MRSLLVVTANDAVFERVERDPALVSRRWKVERATSWNGVATRFLDPSGPQALIFTKEQATAEGQKQLERLRERGYLTHVAVYPTRPDAADLTSLWAYSSLAPQLILEDHSADTGLASFLDGIGDPAGDLLLKHYEVADAFTRRLIITLATEPEARELNVLSLARYLGCSRSVFYERLSRSRIPAPHNLQMLFRLLPGVRVILAGETSEGAAYTCHYHDDSVFRRCLLHHFALQVRSLRRLATEEAVLERWLRLHPKRTVIAARG